MQFLTGGKRLQKLRFKPDQAVPVSGRSDTDRDPVLPGKHLHAPGMVRMFMGDKNGPDFCQGQALSFQPLFCLPARDARVDKDGIMVVANIVAISIASGIER